MEGPAGTGKSLACLAKCVMICERYVGARVLVARATRVSMTESVLVTLERELLPEGHPARRESDVTRAGRRSYVWPHSSELVVRGLDNTESVMSSEYDAVYVAEATEITEEDWERLLTRLRNARMPYQQAIADCNPGAPGHWLNLRAKNGQMERLRSRHKDNPSVTKEYLETLAGLTGYRRSRLFDGRWCAADGAVFPEFDESIHLVDDFEPPADWPWYVGWDPGFDHPTAIAWLTVAPNGDIFVADENYAGGFSIAEHINGVPEKLYRGVNAKLQGRTVRRWMGDPHEFFSKRAQGPSCAMQAVACGIRGWVPWANQSKQAMVNRLRELLQNTVKREGRRLFVMNRCKNTIMEFQTWAFKRTNSGELPKGDDAYEDANNHLMDCLVGMVNTPLSFDGGGKAEVTQNG